MAGRYRGSMKVRHLPRPRPSDFFGIHTGTTFASSERMRSLLLPLAALPAFTGACLLDETGPDAPVPPAVTSGTYHHYVQSSWRLPSTSDEARRVGFDLDGDGQVENAAGQVLAALGGLGLDVQTESDRAIVAGELVILHSVRADDLVDDASVSWRVLAGFPTTPPRWDGTDLFRVAGEDGSLVGPIVDRDARMDWGVVNVPLPFFPAQGPVILPLASARITATLSADGCEGRIGGVMLDRDRELTLERFVRQAIAHIERNPEHEFARAAHQIFDDNDDGVITVEEMAGSSIAESLFGPDVDTDGDGRDDGLSFGLGFTCTPAQFWAPGEV
jgi:hypothetical protein